MQRDESAGQTIDLLAGKDDLIVRQRNWIKRVKLSLPFGKHDANLRESS